MTRGVRELIIFVGGLVVGAAGSLIATKFYYQKKADGEIESVEKAFTDRLREIEGEKDDALDAASKALLSANDYHREDPGASELLRNKSTLDGIIKAGKADRVDYSLYYGSDDGKAVSDAAKNSKESIEVDDHPHDDGEDGDMNDGIDEPIIELGSGRDDLREPYEIDYREYGSLPTFEFKELYFYQGDGTLVEAEGESEDIIDNHSYLVGNVLEKSGFTKNEEKTIYVRNEYISCDFEVMKVFGSYA